MAEEYRKIFSFDERLKEIDRFFAGRSQVHQTMRKLVRHLEEAGIPYAIYGGMAVNAHGHRQTTDDVDVLLTAIGLNDFRQRFASQYEPTPLRHGRRFLNRTNKVPIDVVVTGHCPGPRVPLAITYPDPDEVGQVINGIRFVNLDWLIQLKLATRRHRDLGDVGALIRIHELGESYLAKLPHTMHKDFIGCLEENRRQEEFEAAQSPESFLSIEGDLE